MAEAPQTRYSLRHRVLKVVPAYARSLKRISLITVAEAAKEGLAAAYRTMLAHAQSTDHIMRRSRKRKARSRERSNSTSAKSARSSNFACLGKIATSSKLSSTPQRNSAVETDENMNLSCSTSKALTVPCGEQIEICRPLSDTGVPEDYTRKEKSHSEEMDGEKKERLLLISTLAFAKTAASESASPGDIASAYVSTPRRSASTVVETDENMNISCSCSNDLPNVDSCKRPVNMEMSAMKGIDGKKKESVLFSSTFTSEKTAVSNDSNSSPKTNNLIECTYPSTSRQNSNVAIETETDENVNENESSSKHSAVLDDFIFNPRPLLSDSGRSQQDAIQDKNNIMEMGQFHEAADLYSGYDQVVQYEYREGVVKNEPEDVDETELLMTPSSLIARFAPDPIPNETPRRTSGRIARKRCEAAQTTPLRGALWQRDPEFRAKRNQADLPEFQGYKSMRKITHQPSPDWL